MDDSISLIHQKCLPCEGIGEPLGQGASSELLQFIPEWHIAPDGKVISREYTMKNFTAAVDFIDKIALVAEAEDHHPDIHLTGYRKLKIDLSTHALGGLSKNDFILAALIDKLPTELKQ